MNKKQSKTLQPQTPNTIDEKHTEMLNQFHNNEENQVPKLIQEIAQLKARAKTLVDNQIEEYMDIRDKILAKKTIIKTLKSEKKQYLLDNSKYIFNYFEQKKDISTGGGKQNTNKLNSFFKILAKTEDSANPTSDKYNQSMCAKYAERAN